ncbi:MAG: ABC transporter substrate-binding protein [Candidatus Muproteobacteria bacterium RBG_16_60_9]|uniref:ABC transporter substrate-binding protein n=1 Tax=Candidatus Muproteobacteria bacterium RBG_16_60_9 TaxID=1817755 RepID=A0A1F6VI55_9PROT|nr:MAG: ABC transporter substrate-binding protein [Candidatus Muproteobacteria bacterium RBG_16_60_9]
MPKVLKLAARNLARYWRRTLLTSGLIILGIVAVLLFVSVSGSFKSLIVGQITDSMLGHLQVHRRGYVASIDTLPLNLNMSPAQTEKVDETLRGLKDVVASSPRLKLGAMFSNFTETTSIRLNGIMPEREAATVPLLPGRLVQGSAANGLIERGKILIPEILAKGMKLKVGDTIVLVATNLDGSVNGKTFVVQGVLGDVTGPGGRDGYIDIDDARDLLRMTQPEVSEIAIRLKDPRRLGQVRTELEQALAPLRNAQDQPALEVHTWEGLSPFANIARMIDLLDLFIRVMLVGIVLIAVMNVMMMAVYERIREIGTIAAIGTPPRRILALFIYEGLLLGLLGTAIGTLVSLGLVAVLHIWPVHFAFARQVLTLAPSIAAPDVILIGSIVLVVAAAASLQPAWKAARMDPITALRHV